MPDNYRNNIGFGGTIPQKSLRPMDHLLIAGYAGHQIGRPAVQMAMIVPGQ
jgi:hypothetical protein